MPRSIEWIEYQRMCKYRGAMPIDSIVIDTCSDNNLHRCSPSKCSNWKELPVVKKADK